MRRAEGIYKFVTRVEILNGDTVDQLRIIDAHQHFWDLAQDNHPWLRPKSAVAFRYGDYSALKRTYLPADYARDTARQNVVATVHVEAEWNPADPVGETRWLHDLAAVHGRPDAIVAQAWLARDDIADVLAAQAAFPLVRGIRQKPVAAARPEDVAPGAPGTMDDPVWRDGYARLAKHGLSYDLQSPWWHLPEAARLAADFPETAIILNHAGLPVDRNPEGLVAWRDHLAGFAAQPNTALKISGLGVPGADWSVAANRSPVLDAIAIFGAARCMFASNFPVDSLVADYDTIYEGFKKITADLPPADRDALFGGTAARYYRIDIE